MSSAVSKLYSIVNTSLNEHGKYIFTIKVIPKGEFEISAIDLLNNKEKLNGFSVDDVATIVSLANNDNNVSITNSQFKYNFKYLPVISMLFITCMIASNISSVKLASIFGANIAAGVIAFSLSYTLSSLITEVYGYKYTRQLIWSGFICNIVLVTLLSIAINLPNSEYWHNQTSFEQILGSVPRVVIASLVSYTVGEFLNSYCLSKLKLNKYNIFFRIILASCIGILIDTFLFIFIVFAGQVPFIEIIYITIELYLCKLFIDIALSPLIIKLAKAIKKSEGIDVIDIGTNFTPFSLETNYKEVNNKYSIH